MTDYSELIRKARAVPGPTMLTTYPARTTPDPLSNALADALEAQAKEIAKKDFRISELEAALKPFADLWVFPDDLGPEEEETIRCDPDWDEEVNDRTKEDVRVLRGDIRKARAALKEEK